MVRAASPREIFRALAILSATGIPLCWALGQDRVATACAMAAMGVQAALCLLLARRRRVETPAVVVLGLLCAAPGWCFGPLSGFEAYLAILVLLGGMTAGWLLYLALAVGQGAVFVLVLAGVLPDVSLEPVIRPAHTAGHGVAAAVALQAVFLVAFLLGRAFRARYRDLVSRVDEAQRAAAAREALIEEARADYKRALARTQEGAEAGTSQRADEGFPATAPASPTEATDTLPAAPAARRKARGSLLLRVATSPEEVWQRAYRTKLRGVYAGTTALCLGGALLYAYIVPEPPALVAGLIGMAGVVAATWIHHLATRRHPEASVSWPWTIACVFSTGPAYTLGMHTAFGSVLAVPIFVGGLFRNEQRRSRPDRPVTIVVTLVLSHTALFVLLAMGAIPDLGNVLTIAPYRSLGDAIALHALMMSIYVGAFAVGRVVDRRYEALLQRAEEASREAAHQLAQLADARAELDVLLAREQQGIFSGLCLGAYRLGPLLGRGGMGEVYEATGDDGAPVALKVVRGDRVADPRNLRLFLDEAEALGRVRSPHVARILAVDEGELPFIAMEYIDGQTLGDVLRGGRLAAGEVAGLVRDVARGLADVHDAGVLHLDLKPHNVILAESGAWKLVDFGVARRVEAADVRHVMGTPAYMAPEQAMGEAVDARTDLYSLCTVVYRALTGRPPFVGDDPTAIARTARDVGPPDPRRYAALPDDVVLALRIGLAARPEDRFADARELSACFAKAFVLQLPPSFRRRARDLLTRAPWAA